MRSEKPNHARDQSALVRLQPILEILRAVIWTGKIADEKPVSVMLIAKQESAKTECLKHFYGTTSLIYLSDLTSRGLRAYKDKIEKGVIRHIVILDLVRIVSHGRNVTDRTMSVLGALMEEGESQSSDAGGLESWENFPKIGCLMALTPDYMKLSKGKWKKTGFMTRFVPIAFEYSPQTSKQIHDSIARGILLPPPKPIKIAEFPSPISIPASHAKSLAIRANRLGKEMHTYGFRYHKVLRALAKAQARLSGRSIVNSSDIQKVLSWSDFFTMEPIIL